MVNVSWIITQLECYPQHEGLQDVVFNIHWRRQAIDGTYFADDFGVQAVVLDPTAEFTPFANLTPTQVQGWLEDAMGAARVKEIDDALKQRILKLKTPDIVKPQLPWEN